MDRLVLDVAQGVVHPAHVPFVGKAQPVGQRRGDAGPRRRFLGDDDGAGAALGHHGIEMAQEAHRLEVLAPAIDVGDPGVGRPAVVAIEHRRHRIDPQAVDMEALQPMQRARDQEALNLAPAEIVDVGVPVAVEALARIEMLVERRAVEARQAVRIGREMRRHPVERSRRCSPHAGRRRNGQRPRAARSGRWAQTGRAAGSPTSRRTDAR